MGVTYIGDEGRLSWYRDRHDGIVRCAGDLPQIQEALEPADRYFAQLSTGEIALSSALLDKIEKALEEVHPVLLLGEEMLDAQTDFRLGLGTVSISC